MKFEKLGNICDITGGFAFKSEFYKNTGIPIIRISNIQDERIVITEQTVYYNNDSETLDDFLIQTGDILIALSGATTGKFGIYNLEEKALLNQRVGLLRTIPTKLYNKYLFFYLFRVKNEIFNQAQGVAQPNLSNKDLENLKIPLPSLEEQKQIADLLDKADTLRQKRKQSIQLLDDYLKSVFYDMFGDLEQNEKGWAIKKLSEIIIEKPNNGYFAKDFDYNNSGVPIIWISDFINKFYSKIHNLKRVIINENDISKYKVDYGDVLFCRSSLTYEGIGKAGIIPKNLNELIIFECHIIRLKFDINKIIPEYFRMLSDFHYFRKQIEKRSKTATMTTISQEGITDCNICLPPLSLQNQFAQIVGQVEQTKSKMEESLKEIDNLFNSLMNKFFKK